MAYKVLREIMLSEKNDHEYIHDFSIEFYERSNEVSQMIIEQLNLGIVSAQRIIDFLKDSELFKYDINSKRYISLDNITGMPDISYELREEKTDVILVRHGGNLRALNLRALNLADDKSYNILIEDPLLRIGNPLLRRNDPRMFSIRRDEDGNRVIFDPVNNLKEALSTLVSDFYSGKIHAAILQEQFQSHPKVVDPTLKETIESFSADELLFYIQNFNQSTLTNELNSNEIQALTQNLVNKVKDGAIDFSELLNIVFKQDSATNDLLYNVNYLMTNLLENLGATSEELYNHATILIPLFLNPLEGTEIYCDYKSEYTYKISMLEDFNMIERTFGGVDGDSRLFFGNSIDTDFMSILFKSIIYARTPQNNISNGSAIRPFEIGSDRAGTHEGRN